MSAAAALSDAIDLAGCWILRNLAPPVALALHALIELNGEATRMDGLSTAITRFFPVKRDELMGFCHSTPSILP